MTRLYMIQCTYDSDGRCFRRKKKLFRTYYIVLLCTYIRFVVSMVTVILLYRTNGGIRDNIITEETVMTVGIGAGDRCQLIVSVRSMTVDDRNVIF